MQIFKYELMANLRASLKIWIANSRVGLKITAWGFPTDTSLPSSNMVWSIGNKKAAVFPDPVWAQAIKSRFAKMFGMA